MKVEKLWQIWEVAKTAPDDAIFIEGLPGIGNVGKVVVDFLIEKSDAKLIAEFSSHTLPNSVFINEDNLVELPRIAVYESVIAKKRYLFMTGDVQPTDEISSYQFCDEILSRLAAWNVSSIVTLGGIGLQEAPLEPKVFCTGNDAEYVDSFVKSGADPNVYGVVGPIIGVSGLLLGLAKAKDVPAAALLAETLSHPMYLGLRGAKSILAILRDRCGFDFPVEDLDEEILEMESDQPRSKTNPKIDAINRLKKFGDTNYIG